MLDIEYKGANGVILSTKATTVAVDPKLSVAGLKDLKTDGVVELATEERFVIDNKDARLVIEGPGEYETGDFSVYGTAASRHIDAPEDEKRSTIYRIEVGEVRIALVGNIAPKLSEDQQEALGVVDILIIPVGGGGYTLDATSAAIITRQVDPKAVIPVHYADSQINYEVPQDALEVFVKELGAPVETVSKYKIKSAASLPTALMIVEVARS